MREGVEVGLEARWTSTTQSVHRQTSRWPTTGRYVCTEEYFSSDPGQLPRFRTATHTRSVSLSLTLQEFE